MKKTDFYGFEQLNFEFNGRHAILVLPENMNGRIAFKTEYFGAFVDAERKLVEAGFCLAHINNTNRWGTEDNTDAQHEFISFLAKEYDLNPACALIGMSCGGMQAVYLAAKYPENAAVLYLDAPVMNFCSCPADMGISHGDLWDEFEQVRGMTKAEVMLYRNHPIDKIPELIENKVPVLMLYGDMDDVVPYCENGIALEAAYKKASLPIEVICREGCGHHPHGLDDPKIIVDFIIKHTL